jgi:hypothetical protein
MLCADILRASCSEGDVFRCERARNTGKRRTTCVGAKRAVVATRRFTAENVRHRCYYSKPGSMATIGRWYQARIGLSGNALEKRGERRLRHPSARAASRRAIDRRTRRCEGAERGSDGSDAASCNPGHQSGHGMPCPNTDTPTPTIIAYRGISRSAACRAPTLCPNTDTPTPTIIAYRGISRGTACRAPTLRPNTDTPTPTIIAYRGISRGTACRAPTLRPTLTHRHRRSSPIAASVGARQCRAPTLTHRHRRSSPIAASVGARHAPCRCAATASHRSGAQHHHGSIASDERRIGDDASSDAGGNVRGWSASSGVHRVACGVCGGFGGQRRRVNHCLRCLRHTRLPGAAVRQRRRLARQVCDRLGAVLGSVGGADGVRRSCDAEVRRMLCGALSDAQGDYQGMNHNRLPSRQSVQRLWRLRIKSALPR